MLEIEKLAKRGPAKVKQFKLVADSDSLGEVIFQNIPGPYSLNSLRSSEAYMRHKARPSWVQIMACPLVRAKPLSEPMLEYC